MKKSLLLVGAVVLLLVGVAAGMMALNVAPLDGLLPGQHPAEPAPLATEPQGPPPARVDVGTIGVPIVRDGRVHQRLFFSVALAVPLEQAAQVRTLLPRLQDAYLLHLIVLLSETQRDRSLPDPAIIDDELTGVTERVLGKDALHDLEIKAIFQR